MPRPRLYYNNHLSPAERALVDKRTITGPYSRALERGAIGDLNGNSREAKFIKAYERMLFEHVGPNPTPVHKALITRAARLACHLELWDERTLPNGGAVTATGHNHYIAWSNCLVRTLARLGLDLVTVDKAPSLADYLEAKGSRSKRRVRLDEVAA